MNLQIAEITGTIQSIAESDGGAASGIAMVTVIRPGFNLSKQHYYPVESLKRDAHLFEGAKMYVNHQTPQEEYMRPEGDLFNWAGVLKNVTVAEDGSLQGKAYIHHPQLRQILNNLRENGLINTMGVSIRAICQAAKRKIDNIETTVIDTIMEVLSVDFVTEAGAGGGILAYESNAEFLLERLKKLRPDLRVIETNGDSNMEELQKQIDDLSAKIGELTAGLAERDAKIAELQDAADASKKASADDAEAQAAAKADAEAQATTDAAVESALGKVSLPDAAKQKIRESYKGKKTPDGIEKVIEAECAYLVAVGTPGVVQGEGGRVDESTADRAALKKTFKESFIRQGYDDATAEKLAETAAF